MKLGFNVVKKLEGGFADKLVRATGKIAEETREAKGPNNTTLHFLTIEVAEGNFKTNIDILVQPDIENIKTAIQYRMETAFYITFDSQYNRWTEKRNNPATTTVEVVEENEAGF